MENPTNVTMRQLLANQCLTLLQLMAQRRQTVHYESLAQMLGLPSSGSALAQAISTPLYDVFEFCKKAGLPHLTVLVVRKSGSDAGLPGPGFWKVFCGEGQVPIKQFKVETTQSETEKCFDLFGSLGA